MWEVSSSSFWRIICLDEGRL